MDFRLKPHSPAFKLGFKPIDTAKIGLTDAYPAEFLAEVFPSKRGICISENAMVVASSTDRGDAGQIVKPAENLETRFETREEAAPNVVIELDREYPIDGLEIVADSKDRQNALRGLTVWTSRDRKSWVEIWRADPYHIAMGRDWQVNPYEVLPAKYVKIGLRPKADLQMKPEDARMNTGKYILRLNRVQVFSKQ